MTTLLGDAAAAADWFEIGAELPMEMVPEEAEVPLADCKVMTLPLVMPLLTLPIRIRPLISLLLIEPKR